MIRKRLNARSVLTAACAALGLIAGELILRGYDIRVNGTVSILSVTFPGGSPETQLNLGGRVGNWRSDDTIIFDVPVSSGGNFHKTDIYTLPSSGGSATWISNNGTWVSGEAGVLPPAAGQNPVYVGNPWTCPGNEYTLFQASELNSQAGGGADPGAGVDNNVWVYRASSKKIWKLTNNVVGAHMGVLGPQCSEDPIAMTGTINPIPIVYGQLLDTPKNACGTGSMGGPSDGSCQWYGDWEVCFADLNRDSVTLDPVKVSGSYLSNSICEKPRDIVGNPLTTTTGTGSISAGSMNLSATSATFTTNMLGAALTIPNAGNVGGTVDLDTSILTYTDAMHVTLAAAPAVNVMGGTFTVQNKVYYEPHRYVTRLGDFYFSSNRKITTHDSVGVLFNHTSGYFQEFAPEEPGPAVCSGYQSTWFNEFFTPGPKYQHAVFMSDRNQPCANLTLVPEYADRYMCTMPNCTNIIRLSYFNTPGYPESRGSSLSTVTATRGAWSSDGFGYIAMDEYGLTTDTTHYAQLNRFTLRYPSTELSGSAALRNGGMR